MHSGEYRRTAPYASDIPDKSHHRFKLRNVRSLNSKYVAGRAQASMETKLEDTIDRLTKNAKETQRRDPEFSFDSAVAALSGIRRARKSPLRHTWNRLRHGEHYRAVKPSITHKILEKRGFVYPFQEQLDDREVGVSELIYGPELTDEEQLRWGDIIDPQRVKELKESMLNISETRGYDRANAQKLINSGGITMYPHLINDYFRVEKLEEVPTNIAERTDFLLRLPNDRLDQLSDIISTR